MMNDNGAAVLRPRGEVGGRVLAFTLIELLVVIAIITILAAMLMAVISNGRNRGSQAMDINNLRQIALTMQMLATDNGDVLVAPNWDNGGFPGPQGTNTGWLYAVDLNAGGTNMFKLETGSFWETLHNPKLYLCPMDNPGKPRYSQHDGAVVQREQQISSYAMNGAVVGYMRMIYPPVKLSAFQPLDCAFWETDETEPFYFNDGANNPAEGVSGRHFQGGIEATFGGSVDYIKMAIWKMQEASPNRDRLWCYPLSDTGH